jgi:hypothetical protein
VQRDVVSPQVRMEQIEGREPLGQGRPSCASVRYQPFHHESRSQWKSGDNGRRVFAYHSA